MPYVTPDLAVTGNFITAADGNRRRDNDEYLKGNAGPISYGNSGSYAGTLSATGTVSGAALSTGGALAGLNLSDRTGVSPSWVIYASGGYLRFFDSILGDILAIGGGAFASENGGAGTEAGISPWLLSHSALAGFLRSGTDTITYNGDGTIASESFSGGPMNGWAITYEYSGGLLVAQRLRVGGAGGTIIFTIAYGYSGSQIISVVHS